MENNLNQLWNAQNVETPNVQIFFESLKKFKRKNLRKIIVANLIFIATSAIIITIWYMANPQLITTKIGMVLVLLAMVIFIMAYNKLFPLLSKIDENKSNKNYLSELIELKEKQKKLQTTMIGLYFIILSAGIGLYMYEYTSRMTLVWGIACYAITGLWILFNWFYLRPKTIAKQEKQLNLIIESVSKLQNQLNN